MNRSIISLIFFLYPALAWAMCVGGKPPRLTHVEIHSCTIVTGHRDLLIEGKQLEYYELNKPMVLEGGDGKLESWVYRTGGTITCNDILGTSLFAKESRWCCDVIPHQSLECKKGIPTLKLFKSVDKHGAIDIEFLHSIDYRSYVIGEQEKFTGTAIRYYVSGEKNQEIEYSAGIAYKNTSWTKEGVIRYQNETTDVGTTDAVETQRRYYKDGTLRSENTSLVYTWMKQASTNDVRAFTKEWDEHGNLVRCFFTDDKSPCD